MPMTHAEADPPADRLDGDGREPRCPAGRAGGRPRPHADGSRYRPDPASVERYGPAIATRRPAGSSCTSRASRTSAATSTAGCWRPRSPGSSPSSRRHRSSPRRPADAWQRPAAPGQRPVPPPLRPRIPRGDEGHRRRRRRGRGQVRRPAARPARRRRRSTPTSRSNFLDNALEATRHRPGRPARSASPPSKRRSAPRTRALQRLRRHRPGHRRRQDRLRPHHHVEPVPRLPLTTSGSTSSRPRPSRADADLPRRHQSGMDYYMNDAGLLVCETTIAQTRFDAPASRWLDRIRQRPPVRRLDRRRPSKILTTGQQRPVHQRMAAGRHQDQRDRDVRAGHAQEQALAEQQERVVRRHRRASTGAATTPRTWTCGSRPSPALDGRPANVVFHPSDRDRTWLELFDRKYKGRSTRLRLPGVHDAAAGGLALARRQVHHDGHGQGAEDLGQVRPAAGPHLGADRRRATRASPTSIPWSPTTGRPPRRAARRQPDRAGREGRRPGAGRGRETTSAASRSTAASTRPPGTGRSCPGPTPTSGWPPRSPITSRSSPARRPPGPMPRRQARHSRPRAVRPVAVRADLALLDGRRPPRRP